MTREERKLLFCGKRSDVMTKAKALILSKTGSRVADLDQTRLIVLNLLSLKIVDKTALALMEYELW
jgi:hypothetical protein